MKTSIARADEAPRVLPSLRERRRLETRRELIKASLVLFAKHGFEATTIGEIAEAAGVSVATFHRYFPKKDDAVFSESAQRTAELRKALSDRAQGTSILSALRGFFISQVRRRQRDSDPEIIKLRHSVLEATPALRGLVFEQSLAYTDAVCDAIAADLKRHPRTSTPPRIIAGAVMGALTSTGWFWDASGDIERRFNDLFDFLDQTIGPMLENPRSRG